jgi:hypothetical protein
MRIHTARIPNRLVITDALASQQAVGRIADHVTFKTLVQHRSTIHEFAFEVQLEAAVRDNGRRAGNSGSYGVMRPERDGYAATYDEWGWLLAALYRVDPYMHVGSASNPIYTDDEHFHDRTAWTYLPERLIPALTAYGDPFPYVSGRAAHTKRGHQIGRYGYGRSDSTRWGGVHKPRDLDEYRAFAYPLGAPERTEA